MILLATAIGITATLPPPVVPDSAPVEEFSAERAMHHVRKVAAEPHPPGSAAHDAARDYLREQLGLLGMTVEIQQGAHPAVLDMAGRAVPLQNVIGYRKGSTAGRAVLLMAHYDAIPDGPGAGDDASGVATILETLRALGPVPLHNPLLVVFTDGEELGLLGAELFMSRHRYAANLGVVLNFEARGNSGPSFLFQTSTGNAALIREVARVAPFPRANSLAGEVYRRLPNDTDLSVILRERPDVAALNFAFIDGFTAYHTAQDVPAALDPRSVQHHGSWALSLTRRMGAIDIDALRGSGDAVYFNAPIVGLIFYPTGWALPMALAVCLSLGVVTAIALRRRVIRWRGLGWGALTNLVALIAAALLTSAAWRILTQVAPSAAAQRSVMTTSVLVLIGLIGVASVTTFLVWWLGMRRTTPLELAVTGTALWAGLSVGSAALVPATSWITTWPAAGAILALAVATRPGVTAPAAALVSSAGAIAALVLVPPLVWHLQVAMTNHVAAVAATAFVLVILLLPIPLAPFIPQRST